MRYYRITNAEGKSWVMPERNMKVGMMLYQPSSKKGKLLKTLFPLLYWNPLIRKLLHVEVCDFPFDKSIEDYLHDVFKSSYLEYAIFMGTPCKNQKVTIQVFCKCNILGYCKLTQNKDVFKLFENEKQTAIASEQTKIGDDGYKPLEKNLYLMLDKLGIVKKY